MSNAPFPPDLVRMIAGAEAAAAYAALQRADLDQRPVPPAVREALERAVSIAGLPRELPVEAQQAVIGMVEALLRQAVDLVAAPEGYAGWRHLTPALLLEQGRASGMIASLFAGPAGADPDLARVLTLPAPRFLDVGVGVGGLAIAAARIFRQRPGVDAVADRLAPGGRREPGPPPITRPASLRTTAPRAGRRPATPPA